MSRRRPYTPAPRAGVESAPEEREHGVNTLEETAEEREARAEFERKKELDDLRNILEDVRVRDLCWRILEQAGMFADPFRLNALDMARMAGRAAIGRWLWGELEESSPEALTLMLAAGRARRLEQIAEAARGPIRPPGDS